MTVRVGDGTVAGRKIEPFQVAWHGIVYADSGERIDAGIWINQVRRVKRDGRDVIVRTAGALQFRRSTWSYGGATAFLAILDGETLAPISSELHNLDGSGEKWRFDGTHVESRSWGSEPQAKEVVQTFDTPTPAFDISGAIIPFYLGALPLKAGYSGAIPVVGDKDHPLRSLPFKVVRRERVKAGARGMVDAWLVECPDPTTGTLQFWFADGVPFPVRMIVPATPGIPKTEYELIG